MLYTEGISVNSSSHFSVAKVHPHRGKYGRCIFATEKTM